MTAHSRRRKMFFDGESTLAAFIASVSDIDDLIPMLAAYQIEWNKLTIGWSIPPSWPIEAHVSGEQAVLA